VSATPSTGTETSEGK